MSLDLVFKAYDVRGVVPDELDAGSTRRIGAAFARVVAAPSVVVGHDMRPSSPELVAAFAEGVRAVGSDVVLIGLASTDMLYFASGHLDQPGAMFTASHNPARYNGVKMCRSGARPIGQHTGLAEIRELAEGGDLPGSPALGRESTADLLGDYARYLRKLVDLSAIRPLTVVVDAANGMAGHTAPAVFADTPVRVVPLYFELDGTFPNHEANPLEPANLRDVRAKVREVGADCGLAFDGDADRCFVVDERGEPVSPSALTALTATRELARHPGATVIHNLITSRAVPEIVREHGGVPVRTRVGHSFIKAEMARTGAVFGGEHSAHFYFRDFWFADSGMLAALHTLAALGGTDLPLSRLMADFERYAASGEVNSAVADQAASLAAVERAYAGRPGVELDRLDGLTVSGPDWWFNVRPSNTEPLLRLNVEAPDEQAMRRLRDEVLAVIRT
ncbi:MAG: phosphomannomutase/phosphoglucomutase [Streptosporangiales bacterium]|nr:phosphomannomutase/phosphoglucomutase [Streptosporangiales bacterium]MBO0890845.1 phosphomannomutase/phosphoglucomutase [Acidothermales bacterium]